VIRHQSEALAVVVVYDGDAAVVVVDVVAEGGRAVVAETLSCQGEVVANVHEDTVGRTGGN